MKTRFFLIPVIVVFLWNSGSGQNTGEIFGKWKEVYFTFKIRSHDEIHTLTKIISIDNVKDNDVWAYANMKEFLEFSKLGYEITLLQHPSDVPGLEMTNHYDLNQPITTWNYYPTYSAYVSLMTQFQANYPSICKLYTIGTLASGRQLLAVKISDNVNTDEAEPEFLYTSSIHGDELTGYVLMLHLIDYLLTNYGSNTEVTDLVNTMEIYINPLANPDGTYAGGDNTVTGATRENGSIVDLNRNYPDPQDGQHPDGNEWQQETVAFMDFAGQHHFVASCNFHGGVEVVNYPWDTWVTRHADDSWWIYVSREYADTVHMHSPATYMDYKNNGITDGYDWYEVNGGRQDYMNYFHHCREFTIELSDVKTPPASQLETFWTYNWRSLILYMKEARYGICGTVTNYATGAPVAAKITILNHDNNNSEVYSSSTYGDFYRPIKAGTYNIQVSAPCFGTYVLGGYPVLDHNSYLLSIQLISSAGVTTAAVTGITTTTATGGGEVICDGGGTITARGVCWATTTNPVVTGSHTTDGTGLGVFTSNITGLSPNTLYYVRAYATTASGTVYGDNVTFTTVCGISGLPLTENFNSTSLPSCWSQQFSGTGATNSWTVSATANAGGTVNEMKSTYQNVSPGTNRLVMIPVNTTGLSMLNLTFRHMLDAYGTGVTLKIQSSANGTTWTDEAWSVASTSTNISATLVSTTIVNNLNSPLTYIAFTITGNLFQYDYWYVDNVSATACNPVTVFPWSEGFESGGVIPPCWTQEQVSSSGINWTFITGSGNSHPAAAHGGTYNACLKDATTADNKTKLITPQMNLSSLINPQLTFWHTQAVSGAYQDQLSVYYKTSAGGTWTLLTTYTNSITAWTQETITLPSPGATYYIALEGNAKSGYGVCVDDVTVSGSSPTLGVSPSNQAVSSSAGSTSFNVTSNTSWTVSSDQGWCTVTPSGTGNGMITSNYTENVTPDTRIAHITVTVTGLTPVIVTVTQSGAPYKSLNLKAFLEGLYNGASVMRQASDENGAHFSAGIADQVTIELHSSSNYATIIYSTGLVNIGTNGMVTVTNIPSSCNGSYYITVRHRNSLETTSASPVSFAGTTISYDFSTAATQAYGGNLVNKSGVFLIYCGDVNQDGLVNLNDLTIADTSANSFIAGYTVTDLNGDGIVDLADLMMADTNATLNIASVHP